jgi:N utilization substance protein B
MLKKRITRELAMQVLFLWDTQGQADMDQARHVVSSDVELIDDAVRHEAIAMAQQTWDQRESIDRWIEKHAPQWPPRRQPGVDRSILRMAVWELSNAATPPKVVIDEAIELAKHFSTEQSPAFVNGVLDAILKEYQGLTHQGSGFRVQGSGNANTNAGGGDAGTSSSLNPEP